MTAFQIAKQAAGVDIFTKSSCKNVDAFFLAKNKTCPTTLGQILCDA